MAARTEQSAGRLASLVDAAREGSRMRGDACEPIVGLDRLRDDIDMYLVAVNDDSVVDVVARSGDFDGIWAHTSGHPVGERPDYLGGPDAPDAHPGVRERHRVGGDFAHRQHPDAD